MEAVMGISVDERNGMIDNAYKNFMQQYGREPKIPKDKFKAMWADFEKLGLTMAKLQQAGVTNDLIDGRTTDKVLPISPMVNGGKIDTTGKLALHMNKDGEVSLKLYPFKQEANLKEYFGHAFTKEEQENIQKTGSPGKVIMAQFKDGEEKVPVLLTLDKDINHMVAVRKEHIKIPDKFFGAIINEEQKKALLEGKSIRLEDLESVSKKDEAGNKKKFSTDVQYSAVKKGLTLLFDSAKKVFLPNKIGSVELSKEQKQTLQEGKTIFVKNLVDKFGKKYDSYITWNSDNGKMKFSRTDPNDVTVQKTPTNEHKVQVAANNEGHKPEALKGVKGAVEKKQPATPTQKQADKKKAVVKQKETPKEAKKAGRKM